MENVSIWKIENSIEEVNELIKCDYNTTFTTLENIDIDNEEKIRKCYWHNTNGIMCKQNGQTTLRYLHCIAEVEYAHISEKDWVKDNKVVIPRNVRVRTARSFVTFVENNDDLYCIVEGIKANESKIRENLMKTKKDELLQLKWGKINFKNVIGYRFNKDFYYWIIINNGNKLNIGEREIIFKEVKGFKSSTERSEVDYSGSGDGIDEEIPLMSIISMDENFISLHIVLTIDEKYKYKFSLESNGRLGVDCNECLILDKEMNRVNFMTLRNIISDIYFEIIPLLNKKYNESINDEWQDKKINYRKKLCKKIIGKLLEENNLEVKDIISEYEETYSNLENKEIAIKKNA